MSARKATVRAEHVTCWQCSGHGIIDRGYHNPGECPTCDGKGWVARYAGGTYAKYPGGPLLGRDAKVKRLIEAAK